MYNTPFIILTLGGQEEESNQANTIALWQSMDGRRLQSCSQWLVYRGLIQYNMVHKTNHMPFNDNCENRACHPCIQQTLGGPAALLLRQCCGLSERAKREWSLIILETMIVIH